MALLACQKTGPALNKFSDAEIVEIYELKDRRDSGGLIPYLSTHDDGHRYEALLAFATIQDTIALEFIYPALDDSAENIRRVAAFTIGQTKSTSSVEVLTKKIEAEQNARVKFELLVALGRCSDADGLTFLVNHATSDSLLRAGRAWGIYRAGLRGTKSKAGTSAIMEGMSEKNVEVRLAGANYLARIAGDELVEYEDQLISLSLMEDDPLVKMNLVRALGKIDSSDAQEAVFSILSAEEDYRVNVNVLRALKAIDQDQLPMVRESLQNGHAQSALPSALLISRSMLSEEVLLDLATTTTDAAASSVLFKTLLQQYPNPDVVSTLRDKIANEQNPYTKGELIKALAHEEGELDYLNNLALGDEHYYVKTSAMSSILGLLASSNTPDKYAAVLKSAIVSGDVGLLPLAASALTSSNYDFKSSYEEYDFLYDAKSALELPQDAEALIGLQRVIDFFEGGEASVPVENPYNNPINWAHLQSLPKDQRIQIETSKGAIQVELFVEESPGTVDFISRLISKGFYDSLTFHRIVANFVAQGGCPRGDGYGGTQESIRSEFGYSSYRTGTLGMASAGKDTESCQFFITHRPTPHLDGAYTVFGQVVDGMTVAENLTLGDVITSITLIQEVDPK